MADFCDRGAQCTEQMKKEIQAAFLRWCAEVKEEVKRLRKEKNFPEGTCIYCGEKIEEERRELNCPDCLSCHRNKVQKDRLFFRRV